MLVPVMLMSEGDPSWLFIDPLSPCRGIGDNDHGQTETEERRREMARPSRGDCRRRMADGRRQARDLGRFPRRCPLGRPGDACPFSKKIRLLRPHGVHTSLKTMLWLLPPRHI